ncbi:MAG: M23 family metallopeptidase [Thainema sp.]
MFSSIRSQRISLVILQSIGCLGILGFLSAGTVTAQESVPGAADLLQSAPAPVPAPEPPAAAPAPAPAVESAPAPVVVEIAPTAPAPSPAAEAPAPAAPVATEASPAEPAAASTPAAAPEVFPNRGDLPISSGDVFIDPTDYSIGATTRTGPSTVVLSERSTGCQRVVASGQAIPSSICQAPARSAAISQSPSSGSGYRTAAYSRQGGTGLGVVSNVTGQTTAAAREYYNRGARVLNRLRKGEYEFVFPLTIPAPITSAFGWRIHPISGGQRFHAGTDIGAPMGTPVVAAQAGRVVVSNVLRGYGLTVVMDHFEVDDSVDPKDLDSTKVQAQGQTLYAHMSQLLVEPGEWVEQGEVIGLVGSTGNSTGPHLHFELKQFTADGWVLVDPGQVLEYTLAQLVETLRLAEANAQAEAQAREGAS